MDKIHANIDKRCIAEPILPDLELTNTSSGEEACGLTASQASSCTECRAVGGTTLTRAGPNGHALGSVGRH